MRLRINISTINAVMRPYKFSIFDIVGMHPKMEVGKFLACAIHVVPGKLLMIAKGIIMMYNNLEDFYAGLEPLSLVKDDSIQYDQKVGTFDFQIIDDSEVEYDKEEFANVRELMFGARVENDEVSEDVS